MEKISKRKTLNSNGGGLPGVGSVMKLKAAVPLNTGLDLQKHLENRVKENNQVSSSILGEKSLKNPPSLI
jgi:hypothetical protein